MVIERVAIAIDRADSEPCEGAANGMSDDVSDWAAHLARAAIEALAANVSDEMVDAFERSMIQFMGDLRNSRERKRESISASLRAALSEGKGV